ncbi:MAG TPA: hypothetical protein VFQ44_10640 [Streptosporangiaceae bacterium]|nr:hypothetical protein [Streptosporangiaceae bacterium]
MSRVIAMWAHSRSTSTAFQRMMIERGDVIVVHEPWLALTETGSAALPAGDGGTAIVSSGTELRDHLIRLGRLRPVFVKEVMDYRYPCLFDSPAEVASFTHTFIVREPRQTIASHYAMKPTVTSPEIGFERLAELFDLVWSVTEQKPLVLRAERLADDAAAVVREFCDYTGLPFMPEAISWRPEDRPEWRRHRAWHLEAINSSGFTDQRNAYEVTVDNNPVLRSFYDHHYPFYEHLVLHAG